MHYFRGKGAQIPLRPPDGFCRSSLNWVHTIWSRGQTEIYGIICEFVAPPRMKNLVIIFSKGHVLEPLKPIFY